MFFLESSDDQSLKKLIMQENDPKNQEKTQLEPTITSDQKTSLNFILSKLDDTGNSPSPTKRTQLLKKSQKTLKTPRQPKKEQKRKTNENGLNEDSEGITWRHNRDNFVSEGVVIAKQGLKHLNNYLYKDRYHYNSSFYKRLNDQNPIKCLQQDLKVTNSGSDQLDSLKFSDTLEANQIMGSGLILEENQYLIQAKFQESKEPSNLSVFEDERLNPVNIDTWHALRTPSPRLWMRRKESAQLTSRSKMSKKSKTGQYFEKKEKNEQLDQASGGIETPRIKGHRTPSQRMPKSGRTKSELVAIPREESGQVDARGAKMRTPAKNLKQGERHDKVRMKSRKNSRKSSRSRDKQLKRFMRDKPKRRAEKSNKKSPRDDSNELFKRRLKHQQAFIIYQAKELRNSFARSVSLDNHQTISDKAVNASMLAPGHKSPTFKRFQKTINHKQLTAQKCRKRGIKAQLFDRSFSSQGMRASCSNPPMNRLHSTNHLIRSIQLQHDLTKASCLRAESQTRLVDHKKDQNASKKGSFSRSNEKKKIVENQPKMIVSKDKRELTPKDYSKMNKLFGKRVSYFDKTAPEKHYSIKKRFTYTERKKDEGLSSGQLLSDSSAKINSVVISNLPENSLRGSLYRGKQSQRAKKDKEGSPSPEKMAPHGELLSRKRLSKTEKKIERLLKKKVPDDLVNSSSKTRKINNAAKRAGVGYLNSPRVARKGLKEHKKRIKIIDKPSFRESKIRGSSPLSGPDSKLLQDRLGKTTALRSPKQQNIKSGSRSSSKLKNQEKLKKELKKRFLNFRSNEKLDRVVGKRNLANSIMVNQAKGIQGFGRSLSKEYRSSIHSFQTLVAKRSPNLSQSRRAEF